MIKTIKKKKGFTIIELVIVIAIIGILAAITVPKFGDIQKDTKIKADMASAKVISDAVSVLVMQELIPEDITEVEINTATGTSDAAKIGAYLKSIPKSSVYKDNFFKVAVENGNATISVNNDEDTPVSLQVYPKVATLDEDNPYSK